MIRRSLLPLTAALSLAVLPAVATAQAQTTPPAKGPPPSKEALEQAAYEMHVLISAMQSDKVEAPVKDALFMCIYNNSFAKISETMAKVISDNAGKVDKRNADQMLFIMARVCGFNAQAKAGATPAPAKPGTAPAKPATAPTKPAAPAAKPTGSGR